MDTWVIGLAGCGKSSLMQSMSGLAAAGQGGSKTTYITVRVPDERVDKLSAMFSPKKTTFAEFRLSEIPWLSQDASNRKSSAEKYVKKLAGADLLIHVVRGFESPFLADPPDPARDIAALDSEMLLADLVACEAFFDRQRKRPADANTLAAMKKAMETLEGETFLVNADFSEDEIKLMAGFGFATLMRQLIVVNTPEDGLDKKIEATHRRVVHMPLGLAAEVAELDPKEQMEFLADFGFEKPLIEKISQEAYTLMQYISFFTVGEDEVRAWTITNQTPASRAAGKIHSDLERGFIRAEVISYQTFIELQTIKACRDAGKLRAEGKTYIVQDGDIINVKFNV